MVHLIELRMTADFDEKHNLCLPTETLHFQPKVRLETWWTKVRLETWCKH